MLQDKTDRIMEMAGVMSQSIKIDDGFLAREEEIRSRLVTENKVRIWRITIQSGASYLSQGFEDNVLRSVPG